MSELDRTRTVAWQGWRLSMPRRWDAVKLEGDHSAGYALFADSVRPRLGIRWQTPRRPRGRRGFDSAAAVKAALRAEVGQLAADEAGPVRSAWADSLLYVEPDPPGRDVFSAFSPVSGRLVQIAYHAHRREHLLASHLLPTLADLPVDRACPWSVFDLSLVVPGDFALRSHRLNAGDLGLSFAERRQQFTVRQIAVASLALRRMNLDGWIADQQRATGRYYKPAGVHSDLSLPVQGRMLEARVATVHRRRRYFLATHVPPVAFTVAAHDAERDRLVILHGTELGLLTTVAGTVGEEMTNDQDPRPNQ
jgi:hypothetical protein